MTLIGYALEGIALLIVLKSLGHARAAHAAHKPNGVPDWEDLGPNDDVRLANFERWKADFYAPGSYVGESVRSRSTYNVAWVFVLLGALCLLAGAGGGGGAP